MPTQVLRRPLLANKLPKNLSRVRPGCVLYFCCAHCEPMACFCGSFSKLCYKIVFLKWRRITKYLRTTITLTAYGKSAVNFIYWFVIKSVLVNKKSLRAASELQHPINYCKVKCDEKWKGNGVIYPKPGNKMYVYGGF